MRSPDFPADIIAAAMRALMVAEHEMVDSVASALMERDRVATERAAKIAENVGNFGDYQRHELTADFGQPRYDMMVEIAAAIRSQP